jgi:hypothetical protein
LAKFNARTVTESSRAARDGGCANVNLRSLHPRERSEIEGAHRWIGGTMATADDASMKSGESVQQFNGLR